MEKFQVIFWLYIFTLTAITATHTSIESSEISSSPTNITDMTTKIIEVSAKRKHKNKKNRSKNKKKTTKMIVETTTTKAALIVNSTTLASDEKMFDNDELVENLQPCTCGIFLSGQFRNRLHPIGDPVITHELDTTFPCSTLGIRKCQTKCVEGIIQFLPNSANILCDAIDRDIYKEKAFLFVQNCNTTWHNTKLSGGREFCCRDNSPYLCPLL